MSTQDDYLSRWTQLTESEDLSEDLYQHFSYLVNDEETKEKLKKICQAAVQVSVATPDDLDEVRFPEGSGHVLVVHLSEDDNKNGVLAFSPTGKGIQHLPDAIQAPTKIHNGIGYYPYVNDYETDIDLCGIKPNGGTSSSFDYGLYKDEMFDSPNDWYALIEVYLGEAFYLLHKPTSKIYYISHEGGGLKEQETADSIGDIFVRQLYSTLKDVLEEIDDAPEEKKVEGGPWWQGLTKYLRNMLKREINEGGFSNPNTCSAEELEQINSCYAYITQLNLVNVPQLKVLDISNCTYLTTLEGIENLKGLKVLHIRGCNEISTLQPALELPSIKMIDFDYTGISEEEKVTFKNKRTEVEVTNLDKKLNQY